ncbi:NUDIX hydrolase [Alkalihalobacillus trypoxylicola]|uniref:Coenzyme A pyrophosphatase n=1 Tax=Alkalihalobacillus trypoxylicola TaxID=519424 RepID=A0A162E6X2_9BACI|nr:CoA pyrophosphatase [Alkalihalobacillus trypoxylicola]KYG31912.1 coenzyme A pyrophosphatase [Alkalihalobacillus trypoxylicola]
MTYPTVEVLTQKLVHHVPSVLGQDSNLNAAIILPIIETEQGLSLLFEVRAYSLRSQPGEICFPGGRIDTDDTSSEQAALREMNEEVGISSKEVIKVFPLDYIVHHTRGIIYPFVAIIKPTAAITINKEEVDHVFTIPLDFLYDYNVQTHQIEMTISDNNDFPFHKIANGDAYRNRRMILEEYFYYFKDYAIWGLTAKILHHFLNLTK